MANITKFFRNGNTFSAFCRMRYGQSKGVWEATDLWEKTGRYSIGLDLAAADARFGVREHGEGRRMYKPAHLPAIDEEDRSLAQMEEMAAYIHSGAGLAAYYEDRDAGYAY